jgi:hypothetical protein
LRYSLVFLYISSFSFWDLQNQRTNHILIILTYYI